MTPITLYTKPKCVQCDATKREMNKHGIPIVIFDVTEDKDAYDHIVKNGFLQVPVVETPNGERWSGFRPDRIRELAKARSNIAELLAATDKMTSSQA